jgi:hypothetical protein
MKTNFKKWIKCAAVRAIKTMAQTAVSLITVGNMITEMDWMAIASISATAGVYSILTSVAGLPEVEEIKPVDEWEDK